ncbi:MAG: AMP-dependent synthetase/ligase [Myxococcota bacterium]
MSFIDHFHGVLTDHADKALVTEVHDTELRAVTAKEIDSLMRCARGSLRAAGCVAGDRVVLLAPNSAKWVASDLAILFEGLICVPMYARQAPHELVGMMRDCGAKLVVCATEALAEGVRANWADAPLITFDGWFAGESVNEAPAPRADDDPTTIIYTSGTSGEPKGVVYHVSNIDYMLPVITEAIGSLMGERDQDDRVFHYLPFCFAGSRMVLWMCLHRANGIMVSTDLNNLATEFKSAKPNYFLNVPALLERIKGGVEGAIRQKPKLVQALYDRGRQAFGATAAGQPGLMDKVLWAVSKRIVFEKIRRQIGADLECLICGSAPLSAETQRWFEMLGIPVYQVYGLTETTAIVTMDKPGEVRTGHVGLAIPGCELRLGEGDELQVRGPNIFPGYWGREETTSQSFEDGWFCTGDQAEIDDAGNVRVIGRVKNLLVPSSGHNVPPEPIEQKLLAIEGVEQAVLIGHGRPYLTAVMTGTLEPEALKVAVDAVNETLPHYRRVRDFTLSAETFTPENGLLTANQKLRRKVIAAHFEADIEAMYAR